MDIYRFTPEFERHVIWHATLTPSFGKLLKHLADVFWTCTTTKHIGKVLRAWGSENQMVPGDFDVLMHLMTREHQAGRLSAEDLADTDAWLCLLMVTHAPAPSHPVLNELTSTIIAYKQFVETNELVKVARSRGSAAMVQHAKRIIEATNIGEAERPTKPPVRSLDDMLSAMEAGGDLQPLPTLTAIDQTLPAGGIEINSMTLLFGNTNVGKSFLLLLLVAAALIQGKNAALSVLEGTIERASVRLVAILSGHTQEFVRRNKELAILHVKERWPNLGQIAMFQVPAVGSCARDIIDTWSTEAANRGIKFHIGGLDYVDLVEGGDTPDLKISQYDRMRVVCRYFADFVIGAGTPVERVVSPSQSQRLMDDFKPVSINQGADSHHKARITDIALAINKKRTPPASGVYNGYLPSDNDLFVEVECIKNRQQQVGRKTGTIKADLDRAVLLPNQLWFAPYQTAESL